MLAGIIYSIVGLITAIVFFNTTIDGHISHIAFAIVAFSLLFASFLTSFVYSYQKKHLHSHNLNKFINNLPALDKTENLLFFNIYLSFIFITLAIISGFIFVEDMFAQHLAHKTFFAIFAWILVFIIAYLRIFKGLRDNKATITIQIAFILLMVGYFGTKFVLEIIN